MSSSNPLRASASTRLKFGAFTFRPLPILYDFHMRLSRLAPILPFPVHFWTIFCSVSGFLYTICGACAACTDVQPNVPVVQPNGRLLGFHLIPVLLVLSSALACSSTSLCFTLLFPTNYHVSRTPLSPIKCVDLLAILCLLH